MRYIEPQARVFSVTKVAVSVITYATHLTYSFKSLLKMTAFSLVIIFRVTLSFLKPANTKKAPVTQPVQWGSVVPLISLTEV